MEDNRYLSVSYGSPNGEHRHSRSASLAPSTRTVIEDNPDAEREERRKAAIKRRQTLVPVDNLTWWDCIKGACGFLKSVKRKLMAKVDIVIPPEELVS